MKFFKDKKLEVDVYTSEIKLIENHIASILGRLNKLEELSIKPEPVAWMQVPHKDNKPTKFSLVKTWEDDIPLYTNPMRELTDEEIRKVADEVFKDYKNWHYYQIDFARAILKKASEK